MTAWVFQSHGVAQTQWLGASLAPLVQAGDVVLLQGDLGSGKTRFTQGLAYGLGIERPVTSPTFALMEVYEKARLPLYHFDLYRLETEEELESIGFFDVVEGDGVSLVEWAQRFEQAMPDDALVLTLTTAMPAQLLAEKPAELWQLSAESWDILKDDFKIFSAVVASTGQPPTNSWELCADDKAHIIKAEARGQRSRQLLDQWKATLTQRGLLEEAKGSWNRSF